MIEKEYDDLDVLFQDILSLKLEDGAYVIAADNVETHPMYLGWKVVEPNHEDRLFKIGSRALRARRRKNRHK
jgi:hypothetical protein